METKRTLEDLIGDAASVIFESIRVSKTYGGYFISNDWKVSSYIDYHTQYGRVTGRYYQVDLERYVDGELLNGRVDYIESKDDTNEELESAISELITRNIDKFKNELDVIIN